MWDSQVLKLDDSGEYAFLFVFLHDYAFLTDALIGFLILIQRFYAAASHIRSHPEHVLFATSHGNIAWYFLTFYILNRDINCCHLLWGWFLFNEQLLCSHGFFNEGDFPLLVTHFLWVLLILILEEGLLWFLFCGYLWGVGCFFWRFSRLLRALRFMESFIGKLLLDLW